MTNFKRTIILSFFITIFMISCFIGLYISYKNLKIAPMNSQEVVLSGNTSDERISITRGEEKYQVDLYLIKEIEKFRNEFFYLIPPSLRFVEKLLYI